MKQKIQDLLDKGQLHQAILLLQEGLQGSLWLYQLILLIHRYNKGTRKFNEERISLEQYLSGLLDIGHELKKLTDYVKGLNINELEKKFDTQLATWGKEDLEKWLKKYDENTRQVLEITILPEHVGFILKCALSENIKIISISQKEHDEITLFEIILQTDFINIYPTHIEQSEHFEMQIVDFPKN